MKLANIFFANQVWNKIAQLKMKPAVAYRVLKYLKVISTEYGIVESQRVALIHEITKTQPGSQAEINQGTSEFVEYVKRFEEILATDSDLVQFDLPLEGLLSSLDANGEGTLSAQEVSLIEPFFKEANNG